ncbi:daunorubicin resistance protein DrrC [Methanocella sp. CWC-04]|uniref:Daunorubicin resistance protein DrrC n=1 Tax=Methanooceanicella nereidis TaxID=2052831 RepID=A0AAP2RAV0_9EURY|nr:excinuclease ABC subunit UvrA [Methanocella sp. CWC-04]MCD1293632.1 daunorubicin resistance protein DrrC [Methanocella sp. CWC-04]
MEDCIKLTGAREHNLKNIELKIPKNKVVVFTGVSGSGKSSLVFDTIYAEAQRQFMETFSAFSRRYLPKIPKPNVDRIFNLSPAIRIDQKRMGENRRSTVGTATEISTYLRLLFSRCGTPFIGPSFYFSFNNPEGMCPVCSGVGSEIDVDLERLLDMERSLAEGGIRHQFYQPGNIYYKLYRASGYFDVNKPLKEYTKEEMDRLLYSGPEKMGEERLGGVINATMEGVVTGLKRRQFGKEDLNEREAKFFKVTTCKACNGTRINDRARSVTINGKNIAELAAMELIDLREFVDSIEGPVSAPILAPIRWRLDQLIDIGVGYLSLDRPVATLSGGESQRVKMAKQLSCDLVNLVYVLDEPSIGLHPRDNSNLIKMLKKLRDNDNSVLVVEHDPEIIESADYVIDIGPGAGTHGGNVMFCGTVEELKRSSTVTGRYLEQRHGNGYKRRAPTGYMEIKDATLHNLKNVSVKIPAGVFVCVTGVAGSGKSTLINDIFTYEHPDAVIIDQSALGRSSRSNPATYTGMFDDIRSIFAVTNDTKPNLFSFNSEGACPKCKGSGFIEVEMHFLDSVKITCSECKGKRYTAEVLEYKYKGKDISEVLEMTVDDASEFFEEKKILSKLKVLQEVGLGYITLGQSLSSLSGGEAQRIKLASELHKKGNIYVMDEPTTGLHMSDIDRLLKIIKKLVDKGNTVIVIEHNLEVMRHADWIIDMGPEGGKRGGEIVAEGTPEDIIKVESSYTGQYLKNVL